MLQRIVIIERTRRNTLPVLQEMSRLTLGALVVVRTCETFRRAAVTDHNVLIH